MSESILQFQFFWEIEEMLQGKSQTNTNDNELISIVKKGCLANTPYSELHDEDGCKKEHGKFGDSTFILA